MGHRKVPTSEPDHIEALRKLSVIIPFIPEDNLWKDLLQDLKFLPQDAEIIMVGPEKPNAEMFEKAAQYVICPIRYIYSRKGRARQLNEGVKNATGDYFWFLHADTKVPRPSLFRLAQELLRRPDALHYFQLHFLDDGPKLVHFNSMAANWRSKFLGIPFGDQGFAISRAQFYRIGGFPERILHGEDHVFVWEAKRKHVPLNAVPGHLFTSARRYGNVGWGKLTSLRAWLTFRQASLESIKLLKQRMIE